MAVINNKNYQKVVENILSSSKLNTLLKSAIKDLSSANNISLRTMLLGARFVLTNPINAYNLIKLARTSNIYLDPEFQRSLLENSPIWEFLKKHVGDLPKIGQILAKAGFREFQDKSVLDQKGLAILKECFKTEKVLKKLQEIAVEVKQELPDWNKVTSSSLDMLVTDKNFRKFFNEKSEDITNYIRIGATEILPSDYIKTFDDILQKPQSKDIYAQVIKIFNEYPNFKQALAENINNINSLKRFNTLSPEKQIIIKNFLAEVQEQAKPFLKEHFESYKIDLNILDIIPTLLNKIPETKEIFDTLNALDQGVMVALEKSLKMVAGDDKLKSFFAHNKKILPNIALGIIDNTPSVQSITQEYNFDKQMLNIVGEVMSKPEIAHAIIVDLNKGDYMSLTVNIISALNDPSFKLKDILVEQSTKGLFDNLITGILEHDEKGNQNIKQQLINYGLEARDITQLTSIMPILLDKPEALQKVFRDFIKGNYTGMAKELITLTKDSPEIKKYLNNKREIFASILDKTLVDIPGINDLDKKELYNILPSMLNHPDELVKVIEEVEKSNYRGATSALYNLAQKTNYFEGQLLNIIKVGFSYATEKVKDVLSASQDFKDTTIDAMTLRNNLNKIQNGKFNLEGAILVGDLSNIDFSGVSLKNADLTKVTSLKDCNFKKTNLAGAKLPDNLMLLTDTYNLDKTIPALAPELIKEQQAQLIDKAIDKVFLQVQAEGTTNLLSKQEFVQQVKILYEENQTIKDYIIEKLNSLPMNMVTNLATPKTNQYQHITNYINSPLQVLNPLYENIANKQDVKSNLLANILSEQISQKLFDNGDNRGEDFYMINQMLKLSLSEYLTENPDIINSFLEPKNLKKLASNIASTLNLKSKYTWLGNITGGIYLPKEIFNEQLKDNFKNEFEKINKLNFLKQARNIASNLDSELYIKDTQDKSYTYKSLPIPIKSKTMHK
ncbi:pentapeptide repeat-containing protein [Rickettsia canadensis]|uniref:tRNA delta(2)-isopentenylpyrophosphate transferase n=1 Tax=Rickettsia canadensis str. CA410 TaxID=1105107 RepID=A0ABM5MTZ1_RICCA|nr:pentapeptide repeat-containing protein [Rickettsia canadensis]AFB21106.1 tRNA delta(2)-isopentenylpyrophosphate transferase [Rickettsia canadensis str. CA410]